MSEAKNVLEQLLTARPFRPFVIGMLNGGTLRVEITDDIHLPRDGIFCTMQSNNQLFVFSLDAIQDFLVDGGPRLMTPAGLNQENPPAD